MARPAVAARRLGGRRAPGQGRAHTGPAVAVAAAADGRKTREETRKRRQQRLRAAPARAAKLSKFFAAAPSGGRRLPRRDSAPPPRSRATLGTAQRTHPRRPCPLPLVSGPRLFPGKLESPISSERAPEARANGCDEAHLIAGGKFREPLKGQPAAPRLRCLQVSPRPARRGLLG